MSVNLQTNRSCKDDSNVECMSNIHTDTDDMTRLIGWNYFRMYVYFRLLKTKRICTTKKQKETIPPNNFIYICIPLRRLIDGSVLKLVDNHHQYSYLETVVASH
jgi:hypothetical protein